MAILLSLLGCLAPVLAIVDRYAPLAEPLRQGLFGLALLASLALLGYRLFACLVLPTDMRIGQRIERLAGLQPELLTTLIDHHANPHTAISGPMLARLTAQARADLAPFLARPTPRLAGPWLLAALVTFTVGGLVAADVASLSQVLPRIVTPWRDVEPLAGPSIRVQPGDATVDQSRSLTVAASLERAPGPLFIELSTDGLTYARSEMSARGATGYTAELRSVQRRLFYRVVALGSDGSVARTAGPYTVTVRTAPAVLRARLLLPAPAGPLDLPLSATIVGPDTSATLSSLPANPVTLSLLATEPVSAVTLIADSSSLLFVTPQPRTTDRRQFDLTLPPLSAAPARLVFRITSDGGGTSRFTLILPPSAASSPSSRTVSPATLPATLPATPQDTYLRLIAPPSQ